MYLAHFRLHDRPFRLTQDLSYYYSPPHQIPLDELAYAIEEEQGLAVLIGRNGTGKTTVLKRLLQSLPPSLDGVLLSDHGIGDRSLLEPLASQLQLAPFEGEVQRLVQALQIRMAAGKRVVLLIDEAQALTPRQFEEVRFLTNLEQDGRRLLEIVLSGPKSLLERLHRPELAALRQRVAVHTLVEPLDRTRTREYVEHRLRLAGADEPLFEEPALDVIHERTGGVPRLINLLADRALVVAFATGSGKVTASMVEAARSDLDRTPEDDDADSPPRDRGESARILAALERIEEKQNRILERLEEKRDGESVSDQAWLDGLRRST
jgi:general secretion pathway protein A